MIDKKKAIVFVGVSGSGKGTQVELLEKYFKEHDTRELLHFDAGKRFRVFIQQPGFAAQQTKKVVETGGLLPAYMSIWNWASVLNDELKEDMHVIFDGSPRRSEEPEILEHALEFLGYEKATVFYLKLDEDTAVQRLFGRGRSDDTEERIRNRVRWFVEEVSKSLEYFKTHPFYEFIEIHGDKTVEEVHEEIIEKLTA